jgi:hypothetical protein
MAKIMRSRIKQLLEMHKGVAYGTYDRPGPMIGANGKTVESEYPILPVSVMPQAATQLTSDVPPIDDESFEPVTADELSRAVAALTKRLPDDVAPRLYQTVKRHIQKNYEPRMEKKLTTSKVTEATLRRMIRKALIESSYEDRKWQQYQTEDQPHRPTTVQGIDGMVKVQPDDMQAALTVMRDPSQKDPYLGILKQEIRTLKSIGLLRYFGTDFGSGYPLNFYRRGNFEFYVEDQSGNIMQTNSQSGVPTVRKGPAFASLAKDADLKAAAAAMVKYNKLKDYGLEKEEDPSLFRNIRSEFGFGSESAVNQFINRVVEKLKLTSLVQDKQMFDASKNALIVKVLDLIDQSPYYRNDPDAHNRLYRLIDKQGFENCVLRQVYGKVSAKSSSENLRSVLNDLLKFFENEGLIEPNKRVSGLDAASNLLPRYFVETQITNMIVGKDLNLNAITERLPCGSEQENFVRNVAAAAQSLISIIQDAKEELEVQGYADKASWDEMIRRFEKNHATMTAKQIGTIKNQYYGSIDEQIARLSIDALIKAVDELGGSAEPEWKNFLSALDA